MGELFDGAEIAAVGIEQIEHGEQDQQAGQKRGGGEWFVAFHLAAAEPIQRWEKKVIQDLLLIGQ